ncbi:uncharacterized protein BXZ73DRAFT_3641, partial [Epithele typhae]|uniref:uncharacterized protein n=1 Tax=Epithele typhae TaxID=378194 RepID=UPI002008DE48
ILKDLRARINSHSPISRLPAEILSEIFLHSFDRPNRESIPPFLPSSTHIQDQIDEHIATLLPLTHVCQSWRRVALQFPALWTDIDCHSRDQYLAFKERSQELGVSLVLGHTAYISNEAVEEVVSSLIHRVQRLDMELECPELKPPPWIFTASAPRMECLNLVIGCDDTQFLGRWRSSPEGRFLFRDEISSLRALSLSGLLKWIPINSFPNLTHFALS